MATIPGLSDGGSPQTTDYFIISRPPHNAASTNFRISGTNIPGIGAIVSSVVGGTGLSTSTPYAPYCGGTLSGATFQQATTGFSTSGNVLVSNGSSTLPSWETLSSLSIVISGQGTANEVLVNGTSGSAQTGALIFTTPQGIGTSSNVQFGTLSLGTSGVSGVLNMAWPAGNGSNRVVNIGGAVSPTLTGFSTLYTIQNDPTFSPSSSSTDFSSYFAGVYSTPTIVLPSGTTWTGVITAHYISNSFASNAGSMNQYAGVYFDGGGGWVGSGILDAIYGAYFSSPAANSGSTIRQAMFVSNLSVGYPNQNLGGTNNFTVSGQSSFGISSVTSTASTQVQINSTGGSATAKLVLTGNSIDGTSDTDGMAFGLVHNAAGNNKSFFIGLSNLLASSSTNPVIRFAPNASGLIDCIATNGSTVLPFTLGNSGSITNVKGSFVGINDSAAAATLSVVGNAQIGFSSGTVSPTTGLVVSGSTAMGTNTVNASALLTMSSSTQGFLKPLNSAPSTNISSPATGLEAYNSTFNVPYFYNGSAWIGSGGLSFLSALSFSNVASIAYNSSAALPLTAFNSIVIFFENLLPVTGAVPISIQLTNNGGSSYFVTGYLGGCLLNTTSTGSATFSNTTSTSSIVLGASFSNTVPSSGYLIMSNLTSNNPQMRGDISVDGGFNLIQCTQSTGGINGFKILAGSGNISSVTIGIYGLLGL